MPIKLQIQTKKATCSFGDIVLQSIIMNSKTLNSKASLAGIVYNVLHGLEPKKVYPYKTVANPGRAFCVFLKSFVLHIGYIDYLSLT